MWSSVLTPDKIPDEVPVPGGLMLRHPRKGGSFCGVAGSGGTLGGAGLLSLAASPLTVFLDWLLVIIPPVPSPSWSTGLEGSTPSASAMHGPAPTTSGFS